MKITSLFKTALKATGEILLLTVAKTLTLPIPQMTVINVIGRLMVIGGQFLADSKKTKHDQKFADDTKEKVMAGIVKKN